VVLPVIGHVGQVQAKGDGRILGEPVERGEVAGADDDGVGCNDPLGLGVFVGRPGNAGIALVPHHVILCVSPEANVGWAARVVGKILEQLHLEVVGVVIAGEGEEVRGLDAKAGKGRVQVVGGVTRGGRV